MSVSGDGNKGCQEHGAAKALAYLASNLMSARQVAESMSCPVGSGEGRERKEEKIRLVQMGSASSSHWNRAVQLGNPARETSKDQEGKSRAGQCQQASPDPFLQPASLLF